MAAFYKAVKIGTMNSAINPYQTGSEMTA